MQGQPVPWARTRGYGKSRYKTEDVRAWQQAIRDTVMEEIALCGIDRQHRLPSAGPFRVQVLLGLRPGCSTWNSDADNHEKVIYDALTGLLWTDDRLKVIPTHIFDCFETEEEDQQGLYLRLWLL